MSIKIPTTTEILVCYVGCVIPIGTPVFSCTREDNRKKLKDHVLRCRDRVHAEGSGWNYLSMCRERTRKELKR